METVGQLEETARKLEDVTTKLENLAEKMEGIENEAKKEESLFNKILAKKTFGILGWGFFAFVIVSLIAQEIGVTLVRMLHSGGGQIPSIMTYIVSFFPLYLIAFPVLLLIIRKLPDDGRQKEGIGLSTLLKCFCMCITIMYIGNLIGTGLSGVIGGFFGKTSTNNLAELITKRNDAFCTYVWTFPYESFPVLLCLWYRTHFCLCIYKEQENRVFNSLPYDYQLYGLCFGSVRV